MASITTHTTTQDEIYIQRCIELAKNGLRNVAPNPMVGAVIVHKDKIIGEGYHKEYGKAHAEVNAIDSVKDKSLLKEATIYVNLEPCAHYGKTPPCANMIASLKIPRVVIGMADPYEKVSGKGIQIMEEAGCEVICGVLEEECLKLNKRFIQYHAHKRPYIILKWAETTDGFIDIIRKPGLENRPTWITNPKLRTLVHKWRTEEKGILVGLNTVKYDNPRLTVRDWQGANPTRILIDPNLEAPVDAAIFDKSAPSIIFNKHKDGEFEHIRYIAIDFSKNGLQQMMDTLYELEIASVIIEGGSHTLHSFINADLWDEARIFTGNKSFHEGIPAPRIHGKLIFNEFFDKDSLKIFSRIETK